MDSNPKSVRDPGFESINNFSVSIYKKGVFSGERDLSGKEEESKSDLGFFLGFLIGCLVPLSFVFKGGDILHSSEPGLKGYFLWNSLMSSDILI